MSYRFAVVVLVVGWSTVGNAQSGGCPMDPIAPCIGKKCACNPAYVGDPVNMNSLQTYHRATDFEIQTGLGVFSFQRMYTSSLASWRPPSTGFGGNGVLKYRATPFGSPELSTGDRADSINWWHSLFSYVATAGDAGVAVYDTDGVVHQFVGASPWSRFISKYSLSSGADDSLVFDSGEFRFVTRGRTLVFSESMAEQCSGACRNLYPLVAIEDSSGRELAALSYFQGVDGGGEVPRGCPYSADAGVLAFPYINEVQLAGGSVLQFEYGAIANEGGLLNCRLTAILANGSPIQTYTYGVDPGVAGPTISSQSGGVDEQVALTPGASFSVTLGTVPTVVQQFDGGIVAALLGQGREPDRTMSDSAPGFSHQCGTTNCCSQYTDPQYSYKRSVFTAGQRGNSQAAPVVLTTKFASFADFWINSTHNIVVGSKRDECDAGFACSVGDIHYEWRGLVDASPGGSCASPSNAGHPWGTKDKRGSVNLTKHKWAILDGGTGQPTAKIPELFQIQRGASDFEGAGALETEDRSYIYSAQATQRLKTVTTVSSLNPAGYRTVQKNYAPLGNGLVERGTIVDGYTRELDGTLIREYRGVFYLDQRQCGGPGVDPLGRPLRIEGPCRVSSLNATTCFGGLDAEYPVTEVTYYSSSEAATKRGRLASVTRYPVASCAGGLTTTYDNYETYGGIAELHDVNNVQITTGYSGRQPTLMTVDPAGLNLATELGYDSAKHLTSIKRPEGNYLVLCYRTDNSKDGCNGTQTDLLQWVAKANDAVGGVWAERIDYAYWPTGELRSESYRASGYSTPRFVKSYTPDLHGRPAWEGFGDGTSTPFVVSTRAFDAANNVVGLGAAFHSLSDGGIPTSPDYCRSSSGAVSSLCTKLEYDRANRLTTVDADPDGDQSTTADVTRTCFDYDAQGNIRRVSAGCSTSTAPCSSHDTGSIDAGICTLANTEYDVDDFGAVVEVRFPWSNNAAGGMSRYRYDARNNVVAMHSASMLAPYYRAFTWDLLDRPTGMYIKSLLTSVTLYTIGYDAYMPPSGCAIGQNLKGRVAWRDDGYGMTWFSYDAAGRTIAEYKTRDGFSCTSGFDTNHNTLYTYTPNGNVSTITYPYGRKITYLYGAGGLKDRVDSITTDRFSLTGFPPIQRTSTVTLLSSVKWEPFGALRYYRQNDYVGGTPAYRYRTVSYALGGSTAAESEPSTVCAPSTAEVDGNDTSGRVRTLFVSAGGVAPGAGTGDLLTLVYGWRKDMIYKEELCFTGAGQTSGYPYERVYRYDNLRRLTGTTGLVSVQNGTQYARSYGYDSRGNRSSASIDGCVRNLVEGSGRQQDLLYSQGPNGATGCNGQSSGYTYTYDADGRVVNETTAPSGWWSRDFGYGGDAEQGGLDSVYKSVVTHSGGDSTIDYYYDASNRLWLRVLPAGHEEKRFYDVWDNVLTIASPLVTANTSLAYDDLVWLDGKLVATIRGGLNPNGRRFNEASSGDCGRVGATGACGLTHIVNDILPKPILAIHSNSGLISGVGMYDEFGAVNQVPVISGTNHPYTTMGPNGGVVGVGRLPGFAQADARVLYNYVDLPTGVEATVNNDAGVTGTHRGHVWSDWAPRDNYRATVRVGAPSGTTQGVQVDLVEFRSYATGAIPYFPTLRFPGQYADAETEKYINWNRFYDPSTGRYLAPEPLVQDPEFVHWVAQRGVSTPTYAYAYGNPLRYVDPDGLRGFEADAPNSEDIKALRDAHYSRNDYNYTPDYREAIHYWRRLPDWQSIYHQHGSGRNNSKFVSPNGQCEAVYDETGKLVTDDQNMGTYNFAAPSDPIRHFLLDVLPYWAWGNTPNDPTPFPSRVRGAR